MFLPAKLQRMHSRTSSSPHSPRQDLARVAELLRQPLTSIQGFAELLLTQQYDESTRLELTYTLLAEAEHLSNIISEMLDTQDSTERSGASSSEGCS